MKITIPAVLAGSLLMYSCAAQKGDAKLENADDSLAYALGVSVAENFAKSNITEVDWDLVMKGAKDADAKVAKMDAKKADEYIRGLLMKKQEEKNLEVKKSNEEFLEKNKTEPNVVTTESGLQYKITQQGTGISPDANDKVTVHYHGTLPDGTVFDSSIEKGQPLTRGLNGVIPGWTEAFQLLKEGAKATLYIPQGLGYGAQQKGKIPPYSTLIFEVELIKVEKVE